MAPAGPMYQAGTLSGNPLAMTAGLATLQCCPSRASSRRPPTATAAAGGGDRAAAQLRRRAADPGGCAGTMFGFYFLKSGAAITDYARPSSTPTPARYGRFFHAMLERGVYFAPSQFEAAL